MHSASTFDWGPAYAVCSISQNRRLLLSESETLLLDTPWRHIIDLVERKITLGESLDSEKDPARQAHLFQTVCQWSKKGLLVADGEKTTDYFIPDFDEAALICKPEHGCAELIVLTQARQPDFWQQHLRGTQAQTIVVVDDLLDPRLLPIARDLTQRNRLWLLVKPTGIAPQLGPYFQNGSACMDCLATRLRHNQPARIWVEDKLKLPLPVIPIGHDPQTTRGLINWLQKPGIVKTCIDRIYVYQDQSPKVHHVQKLPQCPQCGDAQLMRKQMAQPVQPAAKSMFVNNHFRTVTPEQTQTLIQPHISPLTGVITNLDPIENYCEEGMFAYRSSFFRMPTGTRVERGDFIQVSLGKGITRKQACAGALGETIERLACQFRGDEPQERGLPKDRQNPILPSDLMPFSQKQYRAFAQPDHPSSRYKYTAEPYTPDVPLVWCKAWSLTTGTAVDVPFTAIFANTPLDDERFIRFHSNGCSAGNTLEEAIIQGFLELVERDATAIWWYNRLQRPAFELKTLPVAIQHHLETYLNPHWKVHVLDLTHDFNIPVMAAIAQNKQSNVFRLGFGCHLWAGQACIRALTELWQLMAIEDKFSSAFDFRQIEPQPYLFPDGLSRPMPEPGPDKTLQDPIKTCVEKARKLGLDTLVANTSRPDLPLKTVRVMIPGLCHTWPQFAAERLYRVPVAMGWRNQPANEGDLNPLGLFV